MNERVSLYTVQCTLYAYKGILMDFYFFRYLFIYLFDGERVHVKFVRLFVYMNVCKCMRVRIFFVMCKWVYVRVCVLLYTCDKWQLLVHCVKLCTFLISLFSYFCFGFYPVFFHSHVCMQFTRIYLFVFLVNFFCLYYYNKTYGLHRWFITGNIIIAIICIILKY